MIMKVKYLKRDTAIRLGIQEMPNFHATGSIRGMRRIYGKNALLVRSGMYIYNCESNPSIYNIAN